MVQIVCRPPLRDPGPDPLGGAIIKLAVIRAKKFAVSESCPFGMAGIGLVTIFAGVPREFAGSIYWVFNSFPAVNHVGMAVDTESIATVWPLLSTFSANYHGGLVVGCPSPLSLVTGLAKAMCLVGALFVASGAGNNSGHIDIIRGKCAGMNYFEIVLFITRRGIAKI